jgi:hypothetical protein
MRRGCFSGDCRVGWAQGCAAALGAPLTAIKPARRVRETGPDV